jgi:FkbM family methyltransferase
MVVKVTGLDNLPVAPANPASAHLASPLANALPDSARLQAELSTVASRLQAVERLTRGTHDLVRSLSERRPAVYVGDHLALTRIQGRFLMYADTRDLGITPHLLLDGIWEPGLTRLMESYIKPGMTVVDIGANFGYFTLLAASRMHPAEGLVYAIEPNPRSFEILQKNVALNWLGKWVRSLQCALLDTPKEIELHSATSLLGSASFFVTSLEGQDFQPIPVTARTLDEIVAGPVDVIKMDAEGSEPFIFEGMKEVLKRSRRLKIVMEFNVPALRAAGVDPRAFLRKLRDLQFALWLVPEDGEPQALDEEKLWTGSMISNLVLSRD